MMAAFTDNYEYTQGEIRTKKQFPDIPLYRQRIVQMEISSQNKFHDISKSDDVFGALHWHLGKIPELVECDSLYKLEGPELSPSIHDSLSNQLLKTIPMIKTVNGSRSMMQCSTPEIAEKEALRLNSEIAKNGYHSWTNYDWLITDLPEFSIARLLYKANTHPILLHHQFGDYSLYYATKHNGPRINLKEFLKKSSIESQKQGSDKFQYPLKVTRLQKKKFLLPANTFTVPDPGFTEFLLRKNNTNPLQIKIFQILRQMQLKGVDNSLKPSVLTLFIADFLKESPRTVGKYLHEKADKNARYDVILHREMKFVRSNMDVEFMSGTLEK